MHQCEGLHVDKALSWKAECKNVKGGVSDLSSSISNGSDWVVSASSGDLAKPVKEEQESDDDGSLEELRGRGRNAHIRGYKIGQDAHDGVGEDPQESHGEVGNHQGYKPNSGAHSLLCPFFSFS